MTMSPTCFLADGSRISSSSTLERTESFVIAISRLSEWRSYYLLVRWGCSVGVIGIRYALTSMDHVCLMEKVQSSEYLVESAQNEGLLEDIILLHFLQSSQTHSQRRHDKNVVFTITA